jgi:hypothetical protein
MTRFFSYRHGDRNNPLLRHNIAMSYAYQVVLNFNPAVIDNLRKDGLNLVVSKGVTSSSSPGTDYNAAWQVVGPNGLSSPWELDWSENYAIGWTSTVPIDNGAIIQRNKGILAVQQGQSVNMSDDGEMYVDGNRPIVPGDLAIHVYNSNGSTIEFYPILQHLAADSTTTTFWVSQQYVPPNGVIDITPVEQVKLWAGSYTAGKAVLSSVKTVAIIFDLTVAPTGTATWADDLGSWPSHSGNGTVVAPTLGRSPGPQVIIGLFRTAITAAAVTYMSSKLIDKFTTGIKPKSVSITTKGFKIIFQPAAANSGVDQLSSVELELIANSALLLAKFDPKFGLTSTDWDISLPV